MKIHHATAKKAKSFKIDLTVEDGTVVAVKNGVRLASGLSGSVVLEQAIVKLTTEGKVIQVATAGVRAAKTSKAKAKKSSGPHEDAARAEGWKPVKDGGYKQAGVGGEDGGESDAANWRELCDEQSIEVEAESRSIVKAKYRALYRPNHNTNGDDLAQQLRDYLTYDDDGEDRIDAALLKRFAVANECWVESYSSLKNVGMRRMNIANRLRAKLRKDPKYKIEWVK